MYKISAGFKNAAEKLVISGSKLVQKQRYFYKNTLVNRLSLEK